MERMKGLVEKGKKKTVDAVLEKVFDMIEGIDLFDQVAEMVKTVIPCKLEITVKGKKSLEVNVHGIKQGQLWISIRRIREEKPEPAEPEEATEEEAEETEQAREAPTE